MPAIYSDRPLYFGIHVVKFRRNIPLHNDRHAEVEYGPHSGKTEWTPRTCVPQFGRGVGR
jgi:hypothetical protein